MYKLDNSRYPNTKQGLQALVTAPAAEPHAPQLPGRRLYPPPAAGPVGK